ncbi:MAG: hypothetical protein Q8R28_13875, partial [Dehalococcoidia bacterium]|nr:hypothetical protein [Dehalococcoidia bacterium]
QLTLVDPQVDVYYKMMKPGPAGVQAPLPAPVFSGIEGSRTIIETPPEPDVLSDEERAANEAEADWIRDQAESEHEAASGREATESMEDTHDFKHSRPSPSDVDEAAGASMVAPRRRRGGSNIVPLGRRTS